MAENNNNNNEQQRQQPQPPPPFLPLLQIQDIDDWLRFNGLRSADDDPPEAPEYGSFLSDLNRSEALTKQELQERYQEAVHAKIFQDALQAEEQQQMAAARWLELWKDETMEIVAGGAPDSDHRRIIFRPPLSQVAAECDTIFTMASSRRYYNMHNMIVPTGTTTATINVGGNNPLPVHGGLSNDQQRTTATATTNSSSTANHNHHHNNHHNNNSIVKLSLEEYPASAVQEFLEIVLHQRSMGDISDHHVVDCCHIGHYLQCSRILEGTTHILLHNVNSDNCMSLCQLADQLGLPDLFERALFHMLKSLDHLESQEAYEDFSPDLKDRIADIRAVFTTTNDHHHPRTEKDGDDDGDVNNNSETVSATTNIATATASSKFARKKKHLFFTSLDEYIAIFAENVQYHRERLEEAKEQNAAARYSSYAQSKIEKQELRVLTLEAMLQEQKRLFGKKHNHNTKRPRF